MKFPANHNVFNILYIEKKYVYFNEFYNGECMEQLCKYDMYKLTDRAHIRYGQKYGTKLKKGN